MKKKWTFFKLSLFLSLSLFSLSACSSHVDASKVESIKYVETEQVDENAIIEESKNEEVKEKKNSADTRIFIDSTGREVEIPVNIERVAITGNMAQIYLYALAPEKLVAVSREWDERAKEFIPEEYINLPVLGNLYGSKGELNKEELINTNAQVVIDIGESKKSIVEDMNSLSEQTGIPFIHIDESILTADKTFEKLGELLSLEDEAKIYSDYIKDKLQLAKDTLEKVPNKKTLLYIVGKDATNVIAKGSYHSQVLELVSDNIAVLDDVSSKGSGNEVDMEYILGLDPDVIIFEKQDAFNKAANDAAFKTMRAITDNNYYLAPDIPYSFLGFPPSAQKYLGIVWLLNTLYTEESNLDLKEEVKSFYKTFYHIKLSDADYDKIMKNAIK